MTLARQILIALALALLLWTWFVAYNEPDPSSLGTYIFNSRERGTH